MRHRCAGKKMGRNPAHRYAMERNFVCSVILHERVVTTVEKAKGLRRAVEKMITLGKKAAAQFAKKGDAAHANAHLVSYRRAIAYLHDKAAAKKLVNELGPRYANRAGGYTRILRLHGYRIGDGGSKAIFELVDNQVLSAQLAKNSEAEASAKK
jgi:large subunit ribosomal protein L17